MFTKVWHRRKLLKKSQFFINQCENPQTWSREHAWGVWWVAKVKSKYFLHFRLLHFSRYFRGYCCLVWTIYGDILKWCFFIQFQYLKAIGAYFLRTTSSASCIINDIWSYLFSALWNSMLNIVLFLQKLSMKHRFYVVDLSNCFGKVEYVSITVYLQTAETSTL